MDKKIYLDCKKIIKKFIEKGYWKTFNSGDIFYFKREGKDDSIFTFVETMIDDSFGGQLFSGKESFNYVGAFSPATFLFEPDYFKFLNENIDTNKKVFIYYGKKEISDSMKRSGLYEKASFRLYDFFKEHNIKTRLVVSASAFHNEEAWDNAFLDFINFIYNEDIIYKR